MVTSQQCKSELYTQKKSDKQIWKKNNALFSICRIGNRLPKMTYDTDLGETASRMRWEERQGERQTDRESKIYTL